MITIEQPFIEIVNGKTFLKSRIIDEKQNINDYLWFSSDSEYGQYFCNEVADAFVICMLLPALRTEQDIEVKALISERLFYNIKHSLIYIFHLSYGKRRININCKGIFTADYHSQAVGCGCSLGVDSFAAILSHTGEECFQGYRITHLTYFNVGAHGYVDLEKTKKSYLKDLQMVTSYAEKMNLPLVCIDSNIHIVFRGYDFDQSGDTRNMATVLSMQKLFKRYLYASSYPIKDFRFTSIQSGYYESLLLPLMSTENTELVVANPDMSRTDKIIYIADNNMVQHNLYVCWKELIVNNNPESSIAKIKDNKLNCSRCGKCLRTLLALDILGKSLSFSDIFDLDYWNVAKSSYIAKVIYNKNNDAFYKDLYELMQKTDYKIPLKSKILVFLCRVKVIGLIHRIKRIICK